MQREAEFSLQPNCQGKEDKSVNLRFYFAALVDHIELGEAEHPERGSVHVHVGPALPAGDAGRPRRRLGDVDAADTEGEAGGRGQVRVPDQHQAGEEQAHLPQGRR